MAPFRRTAWSIQQLAEFVLRFNATVPRHDLGEGNAALVIVRDGAVKVQWLRGKDNHWRVSRGFGWAGWVVRWLRAASHLQRPACASSASSPSRDRSSN
jgi:hypothetical protein